MNEQAHNDQPISKPSEDHYGIDPFASALARSIRKLTSPNGSVIALNGPWGSGKSSAVNLIRHHLADSVEAGDMTILNFACWWYRGEEALALAFFRELYAGLSPSLGERLKKSLPNLAARLLRGGATLGKAADLAGAGGVGAAASKPLEWIADFVQQVDSVEKLHAELSLMLSEQRKRFLVVIDDIDRLSPDEALLIFRLVKSVGRLPNVMYLLVYDRQLAEKIVQERYPSEGAHYLEKIVQAAFDLPEPLLTDLHARLLDDISQIIGDVPDDRVQRFMNLFIEGVAPEMVTPRDVTRFINTLAVTWPSVAGEVDAGDFVALEVLRLRHSDLYRAVRRSKDKLCKVAPDNASREERAKEYDELFLAHSMGDDRTRHRRVLMRLFPNLQSIWSNMTYGADFGRQWARERLVCSSTHFDSYFRFALASDALSAQELNELILRADDRPFIVSQLRQAVSTPRASGSTKAAVLLDEMNVHAERFAPEKVEALLSALFEIADEVDVEADQKRGFNIGNNNLRMHWLTRSLLRDRFPLEERSKVLLAACQNSTLGWLMSIADSAWAEHHPKKDQTDKPEEDRLTTRADADELRRILLERIVKGAASGSLVQVKDFGYILYRWVELANDNGAAVKAWTSTQLSSDDAVELLATSFTSYSWGAGVGFLGDLVSKRTTRVNVSRLDRILDVAQFRRRLEEVARSGKHAKAEEFLEAWRRKEEGKDD